MKSHVDKKILGFDMDGVIVDNSALKVKLAGEFGLKLKLSNAPAEIIKKIIAPDVLRKIQLALYHNPKISIEAPLMPGIAGILDKITALKIPFFLISRRLEPKIAIDLLSAKNLWPKYFNDKNAYFVITPEDKNIKAKELGVTHYVDDEIKILAALKDVPNKFLFDHLSVFPVADNYTKVASHEELAKYFLS